MKKKNIKKAYLYIVTIAVLFMGIGYAAVNSVLLEFTGTAKAQSQTGVYISQATYADNLGADLENSKINYATQTMVNSKVTLSSTNPNSYITYRITVYNSTNDDYEYKGINYIVGTDTYSNIDIEMAVIGITEGYVLKSKQSVTFEVRFYYKNSILAANNVLNSIINYKFEEKQETVIAGTLINMGAATDSVFGYSLSKTYIEAIYTVDHIYVPAGATSWDASSEKNNSVIAWSVDNDGNGFLEIYIGAHQGKIALPADSSAMFASFSNVHTMDLSRIDTTQVTNMSNMFYGLSKIQNFDISSFNTSNVTNMASMFHNASGFTELDLSHFNTSKVTNMSNMFYMAHNITNLNLSGFDTSNVTNFNSFMYYAYKIKEVNMANATFNDSIITNSQFIFYYVPTTTHFVVKDATARDWIKSKFSYGADSLTFEIMNP